MISGKGFYVLLVQVQIVTSFLCSNFQGKVIKVLNLWQKNGIYAPEVIQPLLNLPSTLVEGK